MFRSWPTIASLAILGVAATFSLGAHAQYTGPGATTPALNVAEILKNPVDEQLVTLKGRLLRKTGKETYVFSDGSGEIRVDIDDKLFHGQPVSETTLVEIRGEVDKHLVRPLEIDVDQLRIVTP